MTEIFGQTVDEVIDTVEALRAHAGQPSELVQRKVIDRIDPLAERFIAASPLCFVSTLRPEGGVDVTPRGDPQGFVHVLDDRTLALPDRPGNKLMDTFENVIRTGHIGLIFVIPGHRDTLRVAGRAKLVRDETLGARLSVNDRPSPFVVLIHVERVLSHCPKAFIRGQVWSPEHWPDLSDVPSLAELVQAHAALPETVEEIQTHIDNSVRERLY
ncbi:MAG: MSMEG_1061 family FMN-dependent PPOX-type flavoprotein [Paracoccaceae bacterium]